MKKPLISLRQVGTGPAGEPGDDGWTPILATVADGERRVQQVTGWAGGQGAEPVSGWFIGTSGLVETIAEATDIRGDVGPVGPAAESGSVTNDLLAPLPAKTLLGRGGDTSGEAEYLTAAQVRSLVLEPQTVTNVMLADMAAAQIKGLPVGATAGPPQDLNGSQAWKIVSPAGKATPEQAAAGTDDTSFMTPLRVRGMTGWRNLQTETLTTAATAYVCSIPSDVTKLQIEIIALTAVSSASDWVSARLSFDDGATYFSGPTDYQIMDLFLTEAGVSNPGGWGTLNSSFTLSIVGSNIVDPKKVVGSFYCGSSTTRPSFFGFTNGTYAGPGCVMVMKTLTFAHVGRMNKLMFFQNGGTPFEPGTFFSISGI